MSEQSVGTRDGSELKAEVEALVASGAPDEEVIAGVVRLVHDAHPPWDWSGIYLLVDGTLAVGPFAGSDEPPEHSRIEVGEGDRKSTRLNSSHANISYAVFCLK